jgi:nucleoside 2-deoxyribosyltransferase
VFEKTPLPALYFSAALFCSRELIFNHEINKRLEARGFKSFFPQRDKCPERTFAEALRKHFPDELERSQIYSWIVYILDCGYQLYHSDVMIINLDESLDPGCLIELMLAKEMKKPVIGYRSDLRIPYGFEGAYYKLIHYTTKSR